jgi:hypothetical protein
LFISFHSTHSPYCSMKHTAYPFILIAAVSCSSHDAVMAGTVEENNTMTTSSNRGRGVNLCLVIATGPLVVDHITELLTLTNNISSYYYLHLHHFRHFPYNITGWYTVFNGHSSNCPVAVAFHITMAISSTYSTNALRSSSYPHRHRSYPVAPSPLEAISLPRLSTGSHYTLSMPYSSSPNDLSHDPEQVFDRDSGIVSQDIGTICLLGSGAGRGFYPSTSEVSSHADKRRGRAGHAS